MSKTNVYQGECFGHPTGLVILFFTEMWERFSYYGMRGNLVLFFQTPLTDEFGDKLDNPGLGYDKERALTYYGLYTMFVYVAAIPGGIIADRWLGQKYSTAIGAFLLCIGQILLYFDSVITFYTGLGIIVIGSGLLKPNISAQVGQLYAEGDERRDKGFSIFYIGINVGSFFAFLICGWVAQTYSYRISFGLSGIIMILGFIVYISGQKFLKGIGDRKKYERKTIQMLEKNKKLTSIEKDRMWCIGITFFITVIFWGAYEQAGGLLTLYADLKTQRWIGSFEVPAVWFQTVNPLMIIICGTPIALFWEFIRKKGLEASSLFKMGLGIIINGLGFVFMVFAYIQYEPPLIEDEDPQQLSSMIWLILCYLFNTVGELFFSPVLLSFLTKLAPKKYSGLMLGSYFAITGLGSLTASQIGNLSQQWSELYIFISIASFCTFMGLIVLFTLPCLKKLTHGAEDIKIQTQSYMESFIKQSIIRSAANLKVQQDYLMTEKTREEKSRDHQDSRLELSLLESLKKQEQP